MTVTASAVPSTDGHRPAVPELQAVLADVLAHVGWGAPTRLDRWSSVIEFHIEDGDAVHVTVQRGVLQLNTGSHPRPDTVFEATVEGFRDVFLGAQDITHEFANGTMRVLAGDYYDSLLLSRALRELAHREDD